MQRIKVNTSKKREVVDLTDDLQKIIEKSYAKVSGFCQLSVLHTTAALTTADLDLDAFEHLVPKLKYRHPHNPAHVPDHILSALIGTSVAVPVDQGELVLGTWQRVILIELDGPRKRDIVLAVSAEKIA